MVKYVTSCSQTRLKKKKKKKDEAVLAVYIAAKDILAALH